MAAATTSMTRTAAIRGTTDIRRGPSAGPGPGEVVPARMPEIGFGAADGRWPSGGSETGGTASADGGLGPSAFVASDAGSVWLVSPGSAMPR